MLNRTTFVTALLGCLGIAVPGCAADSSPEVTGGDKQGPGWYVFDASGELVGPVEQSPVRRSEAQWREQLTAEQYRIVREAGTEFAHTGKLLKNKAGGAYTCVACGLPLFSSASKFESGTGWPSFCRPIAPANVAEKQDRTLGMVRTEINCARCDGHLGHVFDDGPPPTGLRYCVNSASLAFTPAADLAKLADPVASKKESSVKSDDVATVVFAGGCFWCVEAVFEEIDGVIEAVSGYAGGSEADADYEQVSTRRTDHAEVVRISYDRSKVSYEDLLRVHFATHDPTQLNRQGNDVGRQYRSAIFYAGEQEKALARAFIDDLTEQKIFDKPIVTTLEPLTEFYPAEPYHQNYVCRNPNQSYVRSVALPKVDKVRKKFKEKLKEQSPLEK